MSANVGRAVFLNYAAQDAEAARRICKALRAAGVEVWFSRVPRAVLSLEFWVWSSTGGRVGP